MSKEIELKCGWWMPAGEERMNRWMVQANDFDGAGGRFRYQGHKLDACMALCSQRKPGFRAALDIGAHIGTWSYYLAQRFAKVYAWEPIALHRECFLKNVAADNVTLFPYALAEDFGALTFSSCASSSGDTRVSGGRLAGLKYSGEAAGASVCEARTLDSFAGEIDGKVDFLKVDCEGYEYLILRGGLDLLTKNRPVVMVEQKPGKCGYYGFADTAAVELLRDLGAEVVREIGGDYLMAWPE